MLFLVSGLFNETKFKFVILFYLLDIFLNDIDLFLKITNCLQCCVILDYRQLYDMSFALLLIYLGLRNSDCLSDTMQDSKRLWKIVRIALDLSIKTVIVLSTEWVKPHHPSNKLSDEGPSGKGNYSPAFETPSRHGHNLCQLWYYRKNDWTTIFVHPLRKFLSIHVGCKILVDFYSGLCRHHECQFEERLTFRCCSGVLWSGVLGTFWFI